MLYHDVKIVGTYLMFVDAVAIGLLSALLLPHASVAQAGGGPSAMLLFAFALSAGFTLLSQRLHAYHARRTEGQLRELVALAEVLIFAFGFAVLVTEVFSAGFTGATYASVFALDMAALLVMRALLRQGLKWLRRRGSDYRIWLVVGNNARSAHLVDLIAANTQFGVRLATCVDLRSAGTDGGDDGPCGTPVVKIENVAALRAIIREQVIDEVVIMLPLRTCYDEIQEIAAMCHEAGVSVKIPHDAFPLQAQSQSDVSLVGDMSLVTYFTGPSNQLQLALKRVVDLVGAVVGLILVAPLSIVIAIAIKLDTPGSVLFRSKRLGLHGRKFTIYKFRSMVENAAQLQSSYDAYNETAGLAFKMRNDPRITRVGAFLRQYHLDELPQFWNVLLGDMSLVGPRPLPPHEATGNEWWQRRRLSMPPGLTCFWQVRGDHLLPFEEWVALDLRYIDQWSLLLDFKLILSTVRTLARRQGW